MVFRATIRQFSSISKTKNVYPACLTRALDRGAPIDIHPEVADALATNKPVVALETTIVTHGMPYPVNLATAQSVERNVRSTGAIPATIGVLSGRIKIGLEASQLKYLADVQTNPSTVKLSRRDLAAAIALKKDGGTTCSTTLILAALAGIKVFATGGLGGVHRGGENSMDVSADLQELTRCPVGLVSAGVKSILDIGRRRGAQETLGVPVFTYGKTDDFPAFYSPHSGFKSPWRVDNPEAAADVLHTQWKLGMTNGALFGVPIPETYEALGKRIQQAVEQAVRESEENGMAKRGKEVTPWLLKRVGELTQGKSLDSNIALIENTALVGGRIAVAYAKLSVEKSETAASDTHFIPPLLVKTASPKEIPPPAPSTVPAKLIVVGSAAMDITAQAFTSDSDCGHHSTSPGNVSLSLGGVGRNIAEAAHRVLTSRSAELSSATALISSVGNDSFGRLLVDETERLGMRTDGFVRSETSRSAVCNMVLDGSGALVGGVADMDIINLLDTEKVLQYIKQHNSRVVAIDANVSPDLLTSVVKFASENDVQIFFEPTSVIKSTAILPAIAARLSIPTTTTSPITFASPNLLELAAIYNSARSEPDDDAGKGKLSFLIDRGIAQMAVNLLPFFQHLIIKCGALGVIVAMRVPASSPWTSQRSNPRRRYIIAHGKSETIVVKHFPALALPEDSIVNVTGAGDTLVGAILAAMTENPVVFQDPQTLDEAIRAAQVAAIKTLQSPLAVSPALSAIRKDA